MNNEIIALMFFVPVAVVLLWFTPRPWYSSRERIARLEKKSEALQAQIFDMGERLEVALQVLESRINQREPMG